jgi:hypothetical protein
MTATAVRWRLAATGLLAAGVTAAIYLAGRLIQPDYTFSLLGSDPYPAKAALATSALGLAFVQIVLALRIYGKLPVGPQRLAAPAHRINGAVIFLLTVPVALHLVTRASVGAPILASLCRRTSCSPCTLRTAPAAWRHPKVPQPVESCAAAAGTKVPPRPGPAAVRGSSRTQPPWLLRRLGSQASLTMGSSSGGAEDRWRR